MDSNKVYAWMNKHARPLDLKLYEFLFLEGSKDDVITELLAYQNVDGGFGHGIEPDNTNPNSSSIQAWTAIGYINQLGIDDKHPMVSNLLDYLETHMDDDGFYPVNIKSNNDYPHARWWDYLPDTCYWGFNPSIALWAFIYKYRPNLKVKKLLVNGICHFLRFPSSEMHELKDFIDTYEWLYDIREDFLCFPSFEIALKKQMLDLLKTYDPESKEYGLSPLGFCSHPTDYVYEWIKPYVDRQLIDLNHYIDKYPMWDINFHWGQYEEEFKTARVYWQGIIAVKNTEFLLEMLKYN